MCQVHALSLSDDGDDDSSTGSGSPMGGPSTGAGASSGGQGEILTPTSAEAAAPKEDAKEVVAGKN